MTDVVTMIVIGVLIVAAYIAGCYDGKRVVMKKMKELEDARQTNPGSD